MQLCELDCGSTALICDKNRCCSSLRLSLGDKHSPAAGLYIWSYPHYGRVGRVKLVHRFFYQPCVKENSGPLVLHSGCEPRRLVHHGRQWKGADHHPQLGRPVASELKHGAWMM